MTYQKLATTNKKTKQLKVKRNHAYSIIDTHYSHAYLPHFVDELYHLHPFLKTQYPSLLRYTCCDQSIVGSLALYLKL